MIRTLVLLAALQTTETSDLEVVAPYTATLVHALDGAASVPHHGAGYREWLLGSDPEPAWLRAYRERRMTWVNQKDDGDGPFEAYTRAAYDASSVADLLERVRALLSPDDSKVACEAIVASDRLLASRWPAISEKLRPYGDEMRALVAGDAGSALVKRLREATGLAPDASLRYRVVLVAKAASAASSASTEGSCLVVEVPPGAKPSQQVAIVFHEMTHFAARRAPARMALEQAFLAHGDAGIVAANYWDEAFATAFGNGIAASELDPGFTPSGPYYADPAIDALGRALHARWREGTKPSLGPDLAPLLVAIVKEKWPRDRWTLRDVFLRVELLTDEQALIHDFAGRIRPSSLSAQAPIPATLERPPRPPEKVPRIVLTTIAGLEGKDAITKTIGVTASELTERIAKSPSCLYWTKDADGVPLVLVVARDDAALRDAVKQLDGSKPVPPAGWTDLASLR